MTSRAERAPHRELCIVCGKYYTPTVAKRLTTYFAENPDDTLTSLDAMVKFGCSHSAAGRALRALQKRGVVNKVRQTKRNEAAEWFSTRA